MTNEGTNIDRQRRKITMSGSLTIGNAHELHEQLTPLLSRKAKVTLDLRAVQRVDTAILQLLLAFHRTAATRGFSIAWHEPSDAVLTSARRVGLLDSLELKGATNR